MGLTLLPLRFYLSCRIKLLNFCLRNSSFFFWYTEVYFLVFAWSQGSTGIGNGQHVISEIVFTDSKGNRFGPYGTIANLVLSCCKIVGKNLDFQMLTKCVWCFLAQARTCGARGGSVLHQEASLPTSAARPATLSTSSSCSGRRSRERI